MSILPKLIKHRARMYLIQIFLPQYDNAGKAFSTEAFDQVQALLVEKYGGVTAYVRSPAIGMWKENETKNVRDDIFIYEVMTEQIDYHWWRRAMPTIQAGRNGRAGKRNIPFMTVFPP
jgi:hypothetical protein